MAKNKGISEFSLTLLRVVLGFIFVYHGYLKLFVKGGLPSTAFFFSQIGIPLPNISAFVVAFVELIGGLLLLIGLFTKWTSLVLIFEMAVAFFKVHLKKGFLISNGGYEFVLLILAALVVVLAYGAGKFALGKGFFKSRHLH